MGSVTLTAQVETLYSVHWLESLTCGDTQIPASGLVGAIEKLKQLGSETGRTGFKTQFHIGVTTCGPYMLRLCCLVHQYETFVHGCYMLSLAAIASSQETVPPCSAVR